MSVGHVLLGVLAGGAAHGYDLKREHDARFPGAKPLAFGQVYSTLARLERDGLVEVAETTQEGGPERTTYAMTPAGEASLRDWLEEPEQAGPYAADDLVRKTVTALRLGADASRLPPAGNERCIWPGCGIWWPCSARRPTPTRGSRSTTRSPIWTRICVGSKQRRCESPHEGMVGRMNDGDCWRSRRSARRSGGPRR